MRAFAAAFSSGEPRLDVLVNNAGVLLGERRESPDGLEMTFATNVLGPFLLTSLLAPLLVKSAPAARAFQWNRRDGAQGSGLPT